MWHAANVNYINERVQQNDLTVCFNVTGTAWLTGIPGSSRWPDQFSGIFHWPDGRITFFFF
jgi:hypothetical protein